LLGYISEITRPVPEIDATILVSAMFHAYRVPVHTVIAIYLHYEENKNFFTVIAIYLHCTACSTVGLFSISKVAYVEAERK